MIAGLEQPDSGEISLTVKWSMMFRQVSEVLDLFFQNYALFRYMTVYDNIAFGLKVQKVDKKDD